MDFWTILRKYKIVLLPKIHSLLMLKISKTEKAFKKKILYYLCSYEKLIKFAKFTTQ